MKRRMRNCESFPSISIFRATHFAYKFQLEKGEIRPERAVEMIDFCLTI